jgi:hypothetical protein
MALLSLTTTHPTSTETNPVNITVMQAINSPMTPLEAGGEMFERAKTQSFLPARTSVARPLSEATEIFDTDFEDESEFEEEDVEEYSPKGSFETVSC